MKNSKYNKSFVKNQFWSKNFEAEESTNGLEFKTDVGSSQPKGGPSEPTSSAAARCRCGPAPPMAPSRYPLSPSAGASLYKSREPGVEALLTPTLSIFTPSHSLLLHHLQKYFSTKLKSKETL